MLSPTEIRAAAGKKYYTYLRAVVTGENLFPMRIRFGRPSPSDDFSKLKDEIEALANGNFGYVIEFEERNTRMWGPQRLPSQVRFDTEEQFVKALAKQREVALFKQNVAVTKAWHPAIEAWLASHIRWVLEYESDWTDILVVGDYFLSIPRPGLYIRQLPIPVHTKFIQEHTEVLTSLLMTVLPESSKDPNGQGFEEKFGLKPVEHTIRFRALDPKLMTRFNLTDERMGLPRDRLCALPAKGLRIIITENLMNLECLPGLPNALGIFGQGRAAELLARVDWLSQCDVVYWGDIDEHGLQILARLRSSYPNIRSAMMDIQTLTDLRSLCGKGEKAGETPKNLTPEERAAYDLVAANDLRLEQEKIPLGYSNAKLEKAFA